MIYHLSIHDTGDTGRALWSGTVHWRVETELLSHDDQHGRVSVRNHIFRKKVSDTK
jgi:hypothetical protein